MQSNFLQWANGSVEKFLHQPAVRKQKRTCKLGELTLIWDSLTSSGRLETMILSAGWAVAGAIVALVPLEAAERVRVAGPLAGLLPNN